MSLKSVEDVMVWTDMVRFSVKPEIMHERFYKLSVKTQEQRHQTSPRWSFLTNASVCIDFLGI